MIMFLFKDFFPPPSPNNKLPFFPPSPPPPRPVKGTGSLSFILLTGPPFYTMLRGVTPYCLLSPPGRPRISQALFTIRRQQAILISFLLPGNACDATAPSRCCNYLMWHIFLFPANYHTLSSYTIAISIPPNRQAHISNLVLLPLKFNHWVLLSNVRVFCGVPPIPFSHRHLQSPVADFGQFPDTAFVE